MHLEDTKCNGSIANVSLPAERAEKMITYKRRKYSRSCAGFRGRLRLRESNYIAECSLRLNQSTKEPLNGVSINYGCKDDRHLGIEDSVIQICVDDSRDRYWEMALEQMLQLPYFSEVGIQKCILYALASRTAGSVSKSVAPKQAENGTRPASCQINGHMEPVQFQNGSAKSNGSCDSKVYEVVPLDVSHEESNKQMHTCSVTECCQRAFADVLVSEKFCSLCSLIYENFKGIKADRVFDFSSINSRLANASYEQSPELFSLDMQRAWKKFEKIGQEMIDIAKSLSIMSRDSYLKQVGKLINGNVGEWKDKETIKVNVEHKDPVDLYGQMLVPFDALDTCTKAEQSDACGSNKSCNCKHCGAKADGNCCIICDGCELVYHVSCVDPLLGETSSGNWHCASCSTSGEKSQEPDSTQDHGKIVHQNCVVCKKLKEIETEAYGGKTHPDTMSISDDSDSESILEDDWHRESEQILSSRLCKLCKTGEQPTLRFVVCHHIQCPYKYYHRRCLAQKQIDTFDEGWYCPSCLCRACSKNKDDDKIVLCDGCDDAYHLYCMLPPRTTVPRGKWYCIFCTIEIRSRHQMMMGYEVIEEEPIMVNGSDGRVSVDMLLSAAEKLNSEENRVSRRRNR